MSKEHRQLFLYPIAEYEIDLTKKDISHDVELYFDKVNIRLHDDREIDGYVFVTAAIPNFEDSEGFIWEESFIYPFYHDNYIPKHHVNSIPKDYIDFNNLPKILDLNFDICKSTRYNEINIYINIKIINTPYIGYLILDHDMFSINYA